MTPPSQRMIIKLLLIFVSMTACSVMLAVCIILGINDALMTAVLVRIFSPYNSEISCPPVAYRPFFWATSITANSLVGSSTLYASLATITSQLSFFKSSIVSETSCSVNLPESRNRLSVLRNFLGANSIGGTLVSFWAPLPSNPVPMPMIPTLATSPSSNALVAWVVPWAIKTTSSGAMCPFASSSLIIRTIPTATPSSCVVGILILLTIS